jgi:UDP-N-acetylmuramoyl-tripeptide--D-alanyl-D-alanine ligase
MRILIDEMRVEKGDYFISFNQTESAKKKAVETALLRGAHVLDVDLLSYAKAYRKKLSCNVIVISGSIGKTTLKNMLFSVLSQQFSVVKCDDSYPSVVAAALALLQANSDTEFLIIEISDTSKQGISDVAQLVQANSVVFTGIDPTCEDSLHIGRSWLSAFGSIFKKQRSWLLGERVCFISASSDYYEKIVSKAEDVGYRTVSYTGDEKIAENINLCYHLGRYFNMTLELIQQGISKSARPLHSLSHITKFNYLLLDDSQHFSDASFNYALQYMSRYKGRKIVVLGDLSVRGMAAKQRYKKINLGLLDYGIDIVFLYGEGFLNGVIKTAGMYHFNDKNELITTLKQEIKAGDVVLVKGRQELGMTDIINNLDYALS